MSGVAIVNYLLSQDAPVLAKVPAAKIFSGIVPLNTAFPAIGIREISSNSRNIVDQNGRKAIWTERVQVTVMAKTYKDVKAILLLVHAALPQTRGTVNGFACDSIRDDVEGPDFQDAETEIYEQSQDFIVKYTR